MQLLNLTRMAAGYTLGLDKTAAEYLLVVVKGTFTLPKPGGVPELADEQVKLVDADSFTGAPGSSATMAECDFALEKPFCDVLLNGNAWAPGGRAAPRVVVGLQLGGMKKAIAVQGDRVWQAGATITASAARPFVTLPVSYDRAFGGTDERSSDPARRGTFADNPVGRGWHANTDRWLVDNMPVSNTEETADPVRHPTAKYRPMAFGPVGRNIPFRLRFAGTYDQHWQDQVFPFLPADFDNRYFQCAPPDQQVPHLRGGENVLLVNLTEDGRRSFTLPEIEMPVTFIRRRGEREAVRGVLDTVTFEPEQERFTLCWRARLRLRRDIFEISQVIAGSLSRARQRAMQTGKSFETLADLVRERRPVDA